MESWKRAGCEGRSVNNHTTVKPLHSPRAHEDSIFYKHLSQKLAELHEHTTATVAVVLHRHSGNYRDVDYLFGAGLALIGLIVLIALPRQINDWNAPITMALAFIVGAWICQKTRLRRWFTSRKRRRRQVHQAALTAFAHEGIYHNPQRAGLLIYWSRLENLIEIVADTGVTAAVPALEWHAWVFHVRHLARHSHPGPHFLDSLAQLDRLLAQRLPRTTASDALPVTAEGVG